MNPHTMKLVEEARARIKARQEAMQQRAAEKEIAPQPAPTLKPLSGLITNNKSHSGIEFNHEQMQAIDLALQGKNFCLIGAAGTGKTTTTQEIITRLERASHVSPISEETKHLVKGAPGIVIVGFTNKAVNNIRKKLPEHLKKHCLTIHKLLEYAPVYYEEVDENGKPFSTMRFEPMRTSSNPLPHISTLIIEESSMVGTDLFGLLVSALLMPKRTQLIMLGDLNQIPPVFGPSILGFKLGELTTVELTHVYRQALLSPIISLATAIRTNNKVSGFSRPAWGTTALDNVPYNLSEPVTVDRGEHGKLTIHPWKQRASKEAAVHMMKAFLPRIIASGEYNPEEDMILIPFNVSFGTIEINKIIANHLTRMRKEPTYEVIARYIKSYWAVGDRVLVDRHEAVITKISRQHGYSGKLPIDESMTLDRWGVDPNNPNAPDISKLDPLAALDALGAAANNDDESKNMASHIIDVYIPDLDENRTLDSAGDINSMLLGYALTIHKSQGSEWSKVFLFLHNSHASMLSRELIYTGVTRAKEHLYIICEGDIGRHDNSLCRAAERPVIPGITLAEKIQYFREKATTMRKAGELDD